MKGVCGFCRPGEGIHRVNREALWQVVGMCDVGGKLLNEITSMYVNSLGCVIVKGGEGFIIKSYVK